MSHADSNRRSDPNRVPVDGSIRQPPSRFRVCAFAGYCRLLPAISTRWARRPRFSPAGSRSQPSLSGRFCYRSTLEIPPVPTLTTIAFDTGMIEIGVGVAAALPIQPR